MKTVKARVDRQGRLVIPASLRAEAGIRPGDVVVLVQEGDSIRLRTHSHAIRTLQRELRALVAPGVSMVDELIAERRAEALREAEEL
jgi:AbrB family looped-hinge helix DNA binding protein